MYKLCTSIDKNLDCKLPKKNKTNRNVSILTLKSSEKQDINI